MTWIIGDIHGCFDELNELLDRISDQEQLIFLGDYIDRGPSSVMVIERLLRERHRSVFLMGNHESMMLAYFQNPVSREGASWLYPPNGGRATLRAYGMKNDSVYSTMPPSHREFYENLHLYHEGDDFIAVHAGVRVESGSIEKQSHDDLLWIRTEWIFKESQWTGKKIYYGHSPSLFVYGEDRQTEVITGINSIGIDTGCVFGGCLTAVKHPTGEIIQINSKGNYC